MTIPSVCYSYLHPHDDIGLNYEACRSDLSGMSDSDWATRYSTSGYVFHRCQEATSWSSKRHPCVALSFCEAEIVAFSETYKKPAYLRRLLSDLPQNKPIGLYVNFA